MMLSGWMMAIPDLEESRRHTQRELARLPAALLGLEPAAQPYPAVFSKRLIGDLEELRLHPGCRSFG
jgi:hypothetical protein